MAGTDAYRTVLATNLPGETETRLLQACLLGAEDSEQAWKALASDDVDVSDLLTHGGHGMRRLAPLLYEALGRHAIEADPDLLQQITATTLDEIVKRIDGLTLSTEHSEHFRPGKPVPTHRVTVKA